MSLTGITLLDICRHAASALGDGMQAEDVLEDLAVIRGRSCWGDARAGWLYAPGEAPRPLVPEMRIEDHLMCLHYIGHVPIALLFFFETEAGLIEHILGDTGYFNPFTTLIVAFRHGSPAPFQCAHAGDDGKARVHHRLPHGELDEPVHGMHPKRTLEWMARPAHRDRRVDDAASGQQPPTTHDTATNPRMRHVIFDAGPWPREGMLRKWITNLLTTIVPKGNPDFEEAHAQAVRWWLEIDADGNTNREIAFDADGRVVAIGPIGRNVGIFTDIDACPEGTYGHIDASTFDAAWNTFAEGRE